MPDRPSLPVLSNLLGQFTMSPSASPLTSPILQGSKTVAPYQGIWDSPIDDSPPPPARAKADVHPLSPHRGLCGRHLPGVGARQLLFFSAVTLRILGRRVKGCPGRLRRC